MSKNNLITSFQAAVLLGITPDYVRRLIAYGKIKAKKYGNSWLMPESAIKHVKRQRKIKHKDVDDGDCQ